MRPTSDERGYMVAIEAALLLPVLLLVVGLVIVLGRSALAEQAVGAAAANAARAASMERTIPGATASATTTARVSLGESSITCAHQSVSVNAAGLASAPGVPASVSVTVTCQVIFKLSLPGFPSQSDVSATRSSPVDTFRSR
ncbi:TadE/TadG family type IV pilus assembly protein [Tessaracoccus antarcticus]|uniref:Pilus assembly protein n=1 Tax=Tessaracoccus antarcticus TaxID=2479848 RepID=A0A3M0FX35_9ACTN|nr:TadE/TadG family type IV pilus assembly protein [Tessaracoccus antarcticus]RMB57038.1 pilus assembly protein [Tessaracoccus antarcticus]